MPDFESSFVASGSCASSNGCSWLCSVETVRAGAMFGAFVSSFRDVVGGESLDSVAPGNELSFVGGDSGSSATGAGCATVVGSTAISCASDSCFVDAVSSGSTSFVESVSVSFAGCSLGVGAAEKWGDGIAGSSGRDDILSKRSLDDHLARMSRACCMECLTGVSLSIDIPQFLHRRLSTED